jgi:D-sedoheptulose 7-phosphate isomerase
MTEPTIVGSRVAALRAALDEIGGVDAPVRAAANAIATSLRAGGTLFTAGNGGSAAQAQHLAAELTGRLQADRERPPLRAVALGADAPTLTSLANDYGFEEVFARQLSGLARDGDVLAVVSTSGRSPNVVRAVHDAQALGVTTVGLLGPNRAALHESCDVAIATPGDSTATVQELHLLLIHVLVELVEDLIQHHPA